MFKMSVSGTNISTQGCWALVNFRHQSAIAAAPSCNRRCHSLSASMLSFTPVSVDDVISAISRLPDKSSAADRLPVSLMKQVTDKIAPFLTELFDRSMSAGHFSAAFKEAFITPALKKPGLDATNVQSYRPISNLSVVSKLLEWIVAQQLNNYLMSANLPSLQSGFRPGHSTETAVLRVLSDLLEAVDDGDVATLVLLDLSCLLYTSDAADE